MTTVTNTLVIGDLHGSPDALMDILKRAGALTKAGKKRANWEIFSVGDVANCGPEGETFRGFVSQDHETLVYADKFCDKIAVGNHEVYFTHGLLIGKWYGMADDGQLAVETLVKLKEMAYSKKFEAAIASHGYLITHAGVAPRYFNSIGTWDAEQAATKLNQYLERRTDGSMQPVGILDDWDGIFWVRPPDVANDPWQTSEWNLLQIVGHTPLDEAPMFFGPFKTWFIDSGGYMKGKGSGILWDHDAETWVRVD